MTAQRTDTFLFREEQYDVIRVGRDRSVPVNIRMYSYDVFSPKEFGLTPKQISTACRRGYYATYSAENDKLQLVNLTINDETGSYPDINGVHAEIILSRPERIYSNIGVDLSFSGQLRLARDFIKEMYIHMGYQTAHCFHIVYDLTFEKGVLAQVLDRSQEVEAFRNNHSQSDLSELDTSAERIIKSFSQGMDLD